MNVGSNPGVSGLPPASPALPPSSGIAAGQQTSDRDGDGRQTYDVWDRQSEGGDEGASSDADASDSPPSSEARDDDEANGQLDLRM